MPKGQNRYAKQIIALAKTGHKIAKTIIPYTETAKVVYEDVIRPQLGKRGIVFLQSVLDRIFEIVESKPEISVQSILSNPDFAAFVMEATRVAVLTSSEEKREALRNAVLNFVVGLDPGEDLCSVFLRAIADLTPTHIRILRILQKPKFWFRDSGIKPPIPEPTIEESMRIAFRDFDERRDFYEFLHAELGTRGFAERRMHPGAFPNRPVTKTITTLGNELLNFITFSKK